MIRRLVEADREMAVRLLEREPEYNLYQLGNLEKIGFDADLCEFWGDFGPGRRSLRGILNRYLTGWIAFGDAEADWDGLGHIVDTYPTQATRLQDNPGGVASFVPYLRRYRAQKSPAETLMRLEPGDFRPVDATEGVKVRRAKLDDLPALVDFYADAGHMSRTPAAVEQPLRNTQIWIAEYDGRIAGAALTNAETRMQAMIGGVYTDPAYRNRGVASAICSALCGSLLAAGKQPVLYWDTPAAGVVYRRLGFREVGEWRSVWLEACGPQHRTTI